MNKPHPHAALMRQYADDASETETPWKRWEFYLSGQWKPCRCHPAWMSEGHYRRRPRLIRIGDYDVPEPMREAPKLGNPYFIPYFHMGRPSSCTQHYGEYNFDKARLKNGLCHATREAAELHAKALLALTRTDTAQ